jgi:hypothetical protein
MRWLQVVWLLSLINITVLGIYGQGSNVPPDRPRLVSPPENAAITVRQQIFQVSATDPNGDRLKFKIVVMESPEPPSPPGRSGRTRIWIFDQTQDPNGWDKTDYQSDEVATLTIPQNKLIPEGNYTWWALAYDGKDWSQISEQRKLKVVSNYPPSAPILVSPANNEATHTLIFKVKAEDADGDMLKFKIVVAEISEPPSPPMGRGGARVWVFDQTQDPNGWDKNAYSSGEIATLTVPESKLIPKGEYYWWALAYDGKEWSQISEKRKIVIVNQAPSAPTLVSPPDGATSVPIFKIKAEDADGDMLKFKIVVAEISEPPSPPMGRGGARVWVFDQTQDPNGWDKNAYSSGEIATLTVPESKLIPKGEYYWWALAYDGREWSQISEKRKVKIITPTNYPPSIPTLLSPANNTTVSPTPTFKVKSEDPDGDQVKFEIEVVKGSETKRFETGFFASGSEATFTVPENQSLSSGQWSWRARAIDSKGAASSWSETRTFIVNRPPLTPVLLSPEDKAFVLSTPTLKVKAEDPEGERVKFILELTQGETMKNFETVSINSGEELTFTVPEKLSAGKWQWRAKAIDTKGAESEWSELKTFFVSTVPSKPVLVSPEEDTIVPTSPTFQLKAEDVDEGQPLKFKIVVVEDISPPSPPRQQGEAKIWVFDQTQNPAGWDKGSYTSGEIATFTVPSDKPLPIGRYRWWAFAFDGLEWSERSEQRRIIVVSEQPPSNINAAVDGYLLDLIDKHANSFYNPKWDITLNQYKAWIAAIAWGAGGKGGYSAHSQTNPSYRGDIFYHVNAGTSFTFSTGLGYFQLDREGGEEGWDRWPSIDKLNPEKSLISVLRWHYGNFRAGATLKDFVGFSLWSSIQSEQIAGIWQQVTGTNWDDHKDKKRWLDWQLVKKSLSQNAANQSFRYENNIINIGKVQWIISEGDDIKTDTGKPVIFNGQYETWLIKARSWQGDTLFEYYYTYDPQAQVEVWAWKNNPKYIFTREYGSFIEGQFPDGRIPGTNEAGFTLNHDALIFAGERLALQSGPQYSSGDGNLRYFISASPGAGGGTGGQSRQAGTEVLIINPIDTNLDEKTVQFEGVSHPSSLVEQIVDVQKREIRWRFRLSNIGNELVWVQFSIAPKPNLPSGTLIRSKASVIINEQKFETNELITIIDKKAPQINFQALSPIQSKPKFDVQWTVSDDASGVDMVEIWVSDDGSELFLWRVFTAEESKATYIGRFGHEYFFYVVAVDKAGNRSEFPEVAHGWTKVGQPPKIPAGLRIVTLPIISEYSDPKDVFGFEGDKWVWYDPKTGKYVRYPEPPAYILSVGKAFWGQFSQDTFPKAKGEVINDASPFAVTLQKGWNLVGNPWLSDLVWDISSLRVRIGGQEKSLRELKENEGVEPYAWKWDGSNYRLVFDRTIIAGVDNVLPSWEGAWVYAHTDCELILPPPSQNKGRGTRGEGRVAKGNGWSMRLQASVNGSVGEAVIGIANGTRGLAVGLPPEPPTGNNGVQVILLKNNTPLAVDVRSDGSRRQEWEVLVRWDKGQVTRGMGERKEVVLTFDGIGYAPKDVSAWLVDTVTGKRLYLRTQPSYRFVAQEGEVERKFKVVVERGNDRPLRVVGLKATPMRGQGVVIEFSLTKPAKVEAEVLTLTGRRVAVLDVGSSEGLARRLVWRGFGIEGQKVGSGVYLVRVRAIDEEGREVQSATAVRLR